MKSLVPYIIGMCLSALVFFKISDKFRWRERMWSTLNKKIHPYLRGSVWVLAIVVIQMVVYLFCEYIMIPNPIIEGMNAFILGLGITVMPIEIRNNKREI